MPTRLVWITLLALCDRDGIARCSPLGLAHQARVEPPLCEAALERLSAPDPDSRDMGDGRRIERVPGGFHVLNYGRILEEGAREDRREYMREAQERSRAKKRANGGTIRPPHRDDGGKVEGPARRARHPAPPTDASGEVIDSGI